MTSPRPHSRRRPTLPRRYHRSTIGPGGLNCRVRNGNGCGPSGIAAGNLAQGRHTTRTSGAAAGRSGRDERHPTFEALPRTRGADSRTWRSDHIPSDPEHTCSPRAPPHHTPAHVRLCRATPKEGSSPRPISTGRLNTLTVLTPPAYQPGHLPGDLPGYPVGDLILGWASRLDAFSAYPIRTWLPGTCPWQDNRYTRGPSTPVLSY